jgi:hypothetical protein
MFEMQMDIYQRFYRREGAGVVHRSGPRGERRYRRTLVLIVMLPPSIVMLPPSALTHSYQEKR